MDAFLAALQQRCRGAPQSSPGRISRPRGCLRSSGFGRYQVPRRAFLSKLMLFRRGVELVGRPDQNGQ
eukprot:9132007-Pyramimonas_sp.AAC.1